MSEATIPIKELMEKTEQWLLGQGYKKSTLGFYRATWNRFLSYAEMKRKVFEEKVPNYTPNTTMPWEEDEDLLQWLTQFGKKTF